MPFSPLARPCRFAAARLPRLIAALLPLSCLPTLHGATPPPLVARVNDWAAMPLSGNLTSTANAVYMSRVNFMRPEPGGSGRMWVCDLNGHLQIFSPAGTPAARTTQLLDQAKNRSAYLDFNGQSSTAEANEKTYVPNAAGTATSAAAPNGLFPLFTKRSGYANGLVCFEFAPTYATNGKFYTIHIEANSSNGATGRLPVTTRFPGFNAAGYTSTNVINAPSGTINRQAVLIEWTDTNRANLTFEGSARELLRIGYNGSIHPLGDITFNPTAQPGSAEWGMMYLASGDGGAGEINSTRLHPQRLDSIVGKILRIIPDLSLHTADSTVSQNGRYRIPSDNPFTAAPYAPTARPEIWTLGHRNPHRFTWHLSDSGGAPDLLVE
ncbi:sorbosone dehydrogenase family protein [Luteolibacter sp. Populi]|uniref:PQQ-dependent sugar dehydrogenase n=1 Tax=Luteolibacter sp. Populi TaxID=3230487 RepID=UPI003467C442